MYNPFSLKGKTILITGASSGIGLATAIECSKLGAKVIVTGRDPDRLTKTWERLSGNGHIKMIVDLTNEAQADEITNHIPEIDCLVNAAGIIKSIPFKFINHDELQKIFATNFFAPVLLTQKIVRKKKIKKGGSIIFLSSIDGPIVTHTGNSMYASSKGAISAIAKNMAIEFANQKIRVNCVLPGMTETPLIKMDSFTKEQIEEDMKRYPLRRYGKPEEVAFAIIYLLSDVSSWVTGTNLVIDGGFTLI